MILFRLFRKAIWMVLLLPFVASAHPMPNSVLLLDVKPNGINAELQWPLKEFHFVFPEAALDSNVTTLVERRGAWLDDYLKAHFRMESPQGQPWQASVLSKSVITDTQEATGGYNELVFRMWLTPPTGVSPRHFTLYYSAIMHQLITHKLLIRIRQDWDGGLSESDSANAELGVLMVNPADNSIQPVVVNLDEGNKWKGFKAMVKLGVHHISEGTDHLLFLLVLMLPAPLIAASGRWPKPGGTRYSLINLLKIATAFTIGHSLTLLAGALGWLRLPSQPVEILIAASILVGAIHALWPLFPGKEALVAAGFGLIHGLAFASTLAVFDIDGTRMALSILGFNLGIEIMQLFIVLLVVPWLVILSRYRMYRGVRITGGLFAAIAALGWIVARVTMRDNRVSGMVEGIASQGKWVVLLLAVIALIAFFLSSKKKSSSDVL